MVRWRRRRATTHAMAEPGPEREVFQRREHVDLCAELRG